MSLKLGISIITCTYNPDIIVFRKLLYAIQNITLPSGIPVEFLIIDNNSTYDINVILHNYRFRLIEFKIIKEIMQGLTYARIRAINESKYDLLVFFDDDNEPYSDYLISLITEVKKYPLVGCWGPGQINVNYINPRNTNHWLDTQKVLFQQRNIDKTITKCDPNWELNPPGSGFCIKKNLIQDYIKNVELKNYTATDRIGNQLISGGDVQILFSLIKNNTLIGISSKLKINHLITPKRQSLKYILKLYFWTSSSNIRAYNEVFNNNQFTLVLKNNFDISKQLYSTLKSKVFKRSIRDILMLISILLGQINAHFLAANRSMPLIIKIWVKLLN